MAILPWKIVDSRYLIRDPWMVLRADRCETAAGVSIDPYYVLEPPDWIQLIAFDRQDRILLNRQYRHGAGIISTEFPCGKVERGEAPADAARRELLEETGCAAEELLALPVLSPNPTHYSNRLHAFIAVNTHPVQHPKVDPTEEIEFGFSTIPDVLALIDQGAFLQALHVAYFFLALRRRGLLALNERP
jgi:8-oxo-dGTP pyrophosphatase MutT (NUDIX family)